MKKSLLFIIVLLIAQNIFSQTGGRRFFNKSFYVNNVTLLELTDDLGQSLNTNNIYKVQLVVTGTGTKTGAEYLVWNDVTTASWQIRAVTLSGNSSNHPLLIVENNIVKVYTKHTSKYTVLAFVEEIISNEDDVEPSIFGSSFQWQRDGLFLSYEGNVGIGTTAPTTNKLDVKGTIHSQEVKVDMLGWSDFVFKKEYNLPTLEQVEKHIVEKGHLENIPSEEEVLKNGINLGEMNSKLLQKIEELTLYAIEQQKNTEKLMKIIEEQNKRLEVLEKGK
ncbi:hypothetical protein [Flavobacterium soyae]|uniref:Uncharacterized protein n=1 Tax=Flavobacterium soyae TaxID=2903098 RepID=A0ABZ2UL84_9FLAO